MIFPAPRVLLVFMFVLYGTALSTVMLTYQFAGYEGFLKTMSEENGFFESISVFLLLTIVFIGIKTLTKADKIFDKWILICIGIFSILSFLAAMEEISWGQHLFHFASTEYFKIQNLQGETNLHNLMNANLFSSILYASVYTFLVFVPLFIKLIPSLLLRFDILRHFDISPHSILILLFASVFQIYFYDDFGVWFDMFAHLFALILFAIYLFFKKSSMWLKVHYVFILLSTFISMNAYEIYRFENMQYEIRETFVVLAVLFIFMELIWKAGEMKKEVNSLK